MDRSLYIISYDITNNKRRTKVAKLLEGYGERVQYSVFEVWATPDELAKLRKRLRPYVEPPAASKAARAAGALEGPEEELGSIRIYFLCAECRPRAEILGKGTVSEVAEVLVI